MAEGDAFLALLTCCVVSPVLTTSLWFSARSFYSAADRVSILKALAIKVSLGSDVDLDAIGNSSKVKASNT